MHAKTGLANYFFGGFNSYKSYSAHNWEVIIIVFHTQTLGSGAAVQKPSHEQEAKGILCERHCCGEAPWQMGHWRGAHHIQVTKPTLRHQFEIYALDPEKLFILSS